MSKQIKIIHPDKSEIKRHILEFDNKIEAHLKSCSECKLIFKMYHPHAVSNSGTNRTESLIQSLLSLPALSDGVKSRSKKAQLIKDSWQGSPILAVRNVNYGVERRMRFQSSGLDIDIIVDKLGDELECSLRVSRKGKPMSNFVLKIGNKKLLPCDIGFFNWTTKQPPKKFTLWSNDIHIETGGIKW